MQNKRKNYSQSFNKIYRHLAITFLNVILILFILNAVSYLVIRIVHESSPNSVSKKYGDAAVKSVYPELNGFEIDALLEETWSLNITYEPFTQFKERPHRGKFVNIDNNGFRIIKDQGPWPPQSEFHNIFVFGGSTTFGYGVNDDQTIASYLQENFSGKLDRDVRVYNLGRGFYYSTQERILFEQLLASGFIPDTAIFIDGINEFYNKTNEPLFTELLTNFIENGPNYQVSNSFPYNISLVRLMSKIKVLFLKRFTGDQNIQEEKILNGQIDNINAKDSVDLIESRLKSYFMNRRIIEAISKEFGVQPVFVWQPFSRFRYDQKNYPFKDQKARYFSRTIHGYEMLAQIIKIGSLGNNFLWCADINNDLEGPAYVDALHYSSQMSDYFAKVLVNMLLEKELVVSYLDEQRNK